MPPRPLRSPGRPRRARRGAAAWTAAALLTGCGGGLWVEIGDDGWDDRRPSVSIAAAAATAVAGERLLVVAAAADESGIDEVVFYRRDASGWARLGSDATEPYEWQVPVPADGRSVLEVFARATDRSGLDGDSEVLQVPVRP